MSQIAWTYDSIVTPNSTNLGGGTLADPTPTTGNWVQDIKNLLNSGTDIAKTLLTDVNQISNIGATQVQQTPTPAKNSYTWAIGAGLLIVGGVLIYLIVRK